VSIKTRFVVLGAGFGGLELSTLLSEALRDRIEVTLIDKSDFFVSGFSKLDVMFGHADALAVRLPYKNFGVTIGVEMREMVARGRLMPRQGTAVYDLHAPADAGRESRHRAVVF
jgi:hypothetical protein